MASVGETAIMFNDATLRTRLTPPKVIVEDEQAVPPEYMVTKTTTETKPDKNAIKDAIKNGIHVPGCTTTQTVKLEIK
jgi:hypothetical protein